MTFTSFTPTWNTNFNTWGLNSFSSPWSSSSSSSKTEKEETYKEYQERLKKERELANEEIKIKYAKQELKREYVEELANVDKNMARIKAGKKADGSSTVTASSKESGFWGKAARWISNAGTALVNIGKSIIGIDENGNFDAKKCLKNIAITAGAVALTFLPGVGPFIGMGMLAAGIAGGAVGVAKGISDLDKAKTDAQKDKAQQEICANAFIGITSAFGLKGIGKSFRTASSTSASASSAAPRTSLAGKLFEKTSNASRDMTVNAYKAVKNNIKKDIKDVQNNGFWTTYKSKATTAYKNFSSWKERYNNKRAELQKSVDTRLTDVDNQINEIQNLSRINGRLTPAEQQRLALLKEERLWLQENKTELDLYFSTTNEKSVYEQLIKDNSGISAQTRIANRNASAAPNRVQGVDIPEAQLSAFNKRILAEQKKYSKAVKELAKTKENLMRSLAKHPDDNIIELSNYIKDLNVHKKWYKPSSWFKTDYQLAIGGHNPGKYGEIANIMLTSPASNAPKALGTWVDPIYSGPILFSQELTAEQTAELLVQLETQAKALEKELETVKRLKTEKELEEYKAKLLASQQAEGETKEASK